jgi:tRNA A-37 threonylcarbamoyl transferase component Bud32
MEVTPANTPKAVPSDLEVEPTKPSTPSRKETRGGEFNTLGAPLAEQQASSDSGLPGLTGYELLGELGRGGMGVVYKARQKGLNRTVALKMVLGGTHAGQAQLARFRAEAEAVARLRHPNIVQIYDVGDADGSPFFSLEFVGGGSLSDRIEKKAFTPRDAAKLMEKVARAVHTAHQAGIVHRDLKPGNILLTTDGEPKIADFGLAKYLDGDRNQTATGTILGTPSYAAPEQAAGRHRAIGPATDVYAMGAILYEMLTGRPPFRAETPLATILQVMGPEPAPPIPSDRKVPRDLDTICMKCLEKSLSRRYPSALDLADELGRFLRGESIRARPPGPVQRTFLWCRRNPVPTSLLVAVTLGGAFGIWQLSQLSDTMVRNTALEGARHEAEMLDTINKFYSTEIIDKVKKANSIAKETQPAGSGPVVDIRPDYRIHENAIPIPATMTIDLAKRITTDSQLGVDVRVYSEYPWPKFQKDRPPMDEFERTALKHLQQNPKEPYYVFEEYKGPKDNERPVLRYATARVMQQGCVDCHNSHPDSPKTDWKVGDVRGVVEIIRPLDKELNTSQNSIRSSLAIITGIGTTLLILCVGLLVLMQEKEPKSEPA